MTLQAKLDAFKADFEAGKPPYNVPPSVIETMHRATAELIASAAPSPRTCCRRFAVPPSLLPEVDCAPDAKAPGAPPYGEDHAPHCPRHRRQQGNRDDRLMRTRSLRWRRFAQGTVRYRDRPTQRIARAPGTHSSWFLSDLSPKTLHLDQHRNDRPVALAGEKVCSSGHKAA